MRILLVGAGLSGAVIGRELAEAGRIDWLPGLFDTRWLAEDVWLVVAASLRTDPGAGPRARWLRWALALVLGLGGDVSATESLPAWRDAFPKAEQALQAGVPTDTRALRDCPPLTLPVHELQLLSYAASEPQGALRIEARVALG